MEALSIGQVVLARFPFSDLSSQKLRPCLIIGLAEFNDVLLCQIMSRPYGSKRAIAFSKTDMISGSIIIKSFIRPDKIATLDQKMIVETLGTLNNVKLAKVKIMLKKVFELS